MRRTGVVALVLLVSASTAAVADVGNFQSFSVTPVPSPGQIQLNLDLQTTGTTTTYSSDAVYMGAALFEPPGLSPVDSTFATVFRDNSTTFAHSFSLTPPHPSSPYKYIGGVAYPSSAYQSLVSYYSTTIYAFIASYLSTLSVSSTTTDGGTFAAMRGGTVMAAVGESIPAMTLIGFVTLGLLIAGAGALLLRRA